MRLLGFLILIASLFSNIRAGELRVVVGPESLGSWSIFGADRQSVQSGNTLVLPAGAQIEREFSGDAVILRLVGHPVFSDKAEEWPILSVGPAAVAFVKKGGVGRLILVVDESRTEELPWVIESDGSHQDLSIGYDPASGTGQLGFRGERRSFDAAASGEPVKVWLSAGARAPWPQELMQVLVLTPDQPPAGSDSAAMATHSHQTATDRLTAALRQLQDASVANQGKAASTAETIATSEAAANGRVSKLEVFTPPSFRRSKIVASVRATLAQQINK